MTNLLSTLALQIQMRTKIYKQQKIVIEAENQQFKAQTGYI